MDPRERDLTDQQRLFIDDLNQIRLVDPAQLESSSKLASEGRQFFDQFEQFLAAIREVREAMQKIGHITDRERLKLVSLQSQLERGGEQHASEQNQQLQILFGERQKELDRLRVELQSLKEAETQQNEYLLMCKKI